MKALWTGLAFTAVFVAAGVFFISRGLNDADKYASIASFLLALVALGASAVAGVRRAADRPAEKNVVRKIKKAGQVFVGDHTTVHNEEHLH
jgi:hypothetical protein